MEPIETCKSILEVALTSIKSEADRDGDGNCVIASDFDAFSVDRGKIQSVSQDNQADELRSLGLSVYDQTALEQGILDQVDRALEDQDRRKLEKEKKSITDDILACQQLLKHSESLLFKATAKETITLRNDINKRNRQLQTLKARELALQKKLNPAAITLETESKPETSTAGLPAGDETERERKIRLGEMTPFGSTVGSTNEGTLSALDQYLESQAKLHQSRKKCRKKKVVVEQIEKVVKPKKETVAKKNLYVPLKKSIIHPKKKRKKEIVGSSTSTNTWHAKPHGPVASEVTELAGSDSEYQPSESEACSEENVGVISVKKPRKRRKQRDDPDAWGTDDSDWESSDEEGRLRRRRKGTKSIDDGNLADFEDRLKMWKADEKKAGSADDDGMHSLDGGFQIPARLWAKLYKYQQVGVQWLWELHQQRCGGILGDEMGLGKTIQVIAFFAGLANSPITDRHNCFKGLGPSLVVCPTTVMHQWVREFHAWFPPARVSVLHESGSHVGRREALIAGVSGRSVLVTSYSGLVQNKDALLTREWHYVVLDEGHKIRNPDAQVTIACKQLRTPHRLILSGSPMQNHLKELWSLFDFTFPGKLGTLPVFLAQLAVPITQGGYANASQVQVATAYRCATVLRDTIAPYLLRRLKPDVQAHTQLPAKSEQVLFCRLSDEQRSLYKGYLESGEVARIVDGRTKVFVGLIQLRKICNHPDIFSGGRKVMRWEKEEEIPEEERYGHWRKAGKMLVIESLLKIWRRQGHRVLLFTQSRQMLHILESFVISRGYSYLKLNGQTSISSRQPMIARFNADPSIFVFLLTTRVGGLGVNLTGADRVVIYDPDWNPATDTQARERAWRIGQLNQVTVYRLVTAGTIEEKIYHRQIFKQFLTNKVLRDPRQRRFFKTNDLFELFSLKDEDDGGSTETAAIFAGTNSEVKVNLSSKDRRKKEEPKPSSSRSMAVTEPKEQAKAPPRQSTISFSQEKMDRMKQLAQMLSRKICQDKPDDTIDLKAEEGSAITEGEQKTSDSTEHITEENKGDSKEVVAEGKDREITDKSESKKEGCDETEIIDTRTEVKVESVEVDVRVSSADKRKNHEDRKENRKVQRDVCKAQSPKAASSRSAEKEKKGDKTYRKGHRSKRKELGAKFEGERVPYLVKHRVAREEKEAKEKGVEDDDYVLKKLFKKSGLHEALHHDAIVGEGEADYALVEGEAKRVAEEAVAALHESRRLCFAADTGVPSWTGQNGAIKSSRPRFGKKSATKAKEGDGAKADAMSSGELLSRMKARNRLTETGDACAGAVVSQKDSELLADIRNFVALGAAVDGTASTRELVDRFGSKLPDGTSPLFKALLQKVADFHRTSTGDGLWKLRPEFRW